MAIFVRDKHKRILVCWARRNIRQTLERSRKESRGWVLYFSFVFVFCICISLGLVSPDKGMGVLGRHTPTHQPFSKRRPTCASNNARQCLGLKNQDFFGLRGLLYYVFITTLLSAVQVNPVLCNAFECHIQEDEPFTACVQITGWLPAVCYRPIIGTKGEAGEHKQTNINKGDKLK